MFLILVRLYRDGLRNVMGWYKQNTSLSWLGLWDVQIDGKFKLRRVFKPLLCYTSFEKKYILIYSSPRRGWCLLCFPLHWTLKGSRLWFADGPIEWQILMLIHRKQSKPYSKQCLQLCRPMQRAIQHRLKHDHAHALCKENEVLKDLVSCNKSSDLSVE